MYQKYVYLAAAFFLAGLGAAEAYDLVRSASGQGRVTGCVASGKICVGQPLRVEDRDRIDLKIGGLVWGSCDVGGHRRGYGAVEIARGACAGDSYSLSFAKGKLLTTVSVEDGTVVAIHKVWYRQMQL